MVGIYEHLRTVDRSFVRSHERLLFEMQLTMGNTAAVVGSDVGEFTSVVARSNRGTKIRNAGLIVGSKD
jgi:hypothetical protein